MCPSTVTPLVSLWLPACVTPCVSRFVTRFVSPGPWVSLCIPMALGESLSEVATPLSPSCCPCLPSVIYLPLRGPQPQPSQCPWTGPSAISHTALQAPPTTLTWFTRSAEVSAVNKTFEECRTPEPCVSGCEMDMNPGQGPLSRPQMLPICLGPASGGGMSFSQG